MLFYWNFYSKNYFKNKCIKFSTKYEAESVSNIEYKKCFLSSKSVYYYDFWRSCDTEDCSNDAENTAAHHRNKSHFNRYSHRKQLFEILTIFQNVSVFTVHWCFRRKKHALRAGNIWTSG